jgi:hypothetical protein
MWLAILGVTGSIKFWITVESLYWYKGTFGAFAGFVGEAYRSADEARGKKKKKKDVFVVEEQKTLTSE